MSALIGPSNEEPLPRPPRQRGGKLRPPVNGGTTGGSIIRRSNVTVPRFSARVFPQLLQRNDKFGERRCRHGGVLTGYDNLTIRAGLQRVSDELATAGIQQPVVGHAVAGVKLPLHPSVSLFV